jgi:hypothetical protein
VLNQAEEFWINATFVETLPLFFFDRMRRIPGPAGVLVVNKAREVFVRKIPGTRRVTTAEDWVEVVQVEVVCVIEASMGGDIRRGWVRVESESLRRRDRCGW